MLAALLLGFAVLFAALVGVHDFLLRHAVDWSTEELLSQRLATLLDAVAAAPEAAREGIAQALSRPGLQIRRILDQLPMNDGPSTDVARRISERTRALIVLATELRIDSVRLEPGSGHVVGINASARLDDGSRLGVEMTTFDLLSAELRALYAYAGAFGFALLLAVGFAARSVAAPVASLAAAVARIDLAQEAPSLSAAGPSEVRQLAAALNDMAARTRDAFRQRTLALGALSHDLMSPIARLHLRAEDLPEDAREPIRRDLAEMETMVSDVLAYLRGGHGGEPARPLAITALVRSVAHEFADAGELVEERRMDERAVVNVRRVALKRAITNLVTNAIRHGHGPWVEVEGTADAVLVRVGDSGPGIPAVDLPRVTEPFFRGDRARTAGGGSGLGLATVRAIAEAHGGSLEIKSTPGEGTTATVSLPRNLQPNQHAPVRCLGRPEPAGDRHPPKTV
jgi:signal transduction histidine kinase